MAFIPLFSRRFPNMRDASNVNLYSGFPVAIPEVPPVTLIFVSNAPGLPKLKKFSSHGNLRIFKAF
jgi:hypothetical protein